MIKGEWRLDKQCFYFYKDGDPYCKPAASAFQPTNGEWRICAIEVEFSNHREFILELKDFVQDLENPTIEEITLLELETGLPMEDMFDKLKEILQEGVNND